MRGFMRKHQEFYAEGDAQWGGQLRTDLATDIAQTRWLMFAPRE